jgi:hypothetical protein
MHKAIEMIRENRLTTAEIASLVGFSLHISGHAARHQEPGMLIGRPCSVSRPAACRAGWLLVLRRRLGVVPVAYAAQEVHSRRCCGRIAFELPIRLFQHRFQVKQATFLGV